MKKILIAISITSMVAIVIIGGTIAYFSDTEISTGNTLTAGTLDLKALDYIRWNFPFKDMKPGDSTGDQGIKLKMEKGSNAANHIEIDIDTHSFVDSVVESGGMNTKDDFKKQIRVDTLVYENGIEIDLSTYVNDNADGNPGFISLYDVETYGVFDNLPTFGTGSGYFTVGFSLPTDLPDINDDKYQGDSIEINFEFGVVQVAGQNILD